MLLDHGALINMPGHENETPLHDAINNSRLDCVCMLVSRGADLLSRFGGCKHPEETASKFFLT